MHLRRMPGRTGFRFGQSGRERDNSRFMADDDRFRRDKPLPQLPQRR